MLRITQAVELLMQMFDKYIEREDVWNTLTERELVELVRKEYPEADKNSAEVDSILKKLDADSDGQVTFKKVFHIVKDSNLMSSTSEITQAMQLFKATFDDYAQKNKDKNRNVFTAAQRVS
uniref:protein S100-A12-like n=1 Tax=Epinephelus lanceolatus TaxID=310571 RepID=UPI0014450FD2|nr:protein S100-A12-like [Epinephelus lanceolatus]